MTLSTAATAEPHSQSTFASRAHAHRRAIGVPQTKIAVRTLDIAALELDDSTTWSQIRVPAMPVFESTFAAFAHGTLLQGLHGPVAIEDLRPGDTLHTSDGSSAKVMWIASSTVLPSDSTRPTPLVRVMPDSFGMGRPSAFVTLGPAARLLQTPHHLRAERAGAQLLTPLSQFVDGTNVISVAPPAPVKLFHLCLDRHAIINVGGMPMESFHPSMHLVQNMTHTMRSLFLSLFPRVNQFADFGQMSHGRAPDPDTDKTAA